MSNFGQVERIVASNIVTKDVLRKVQRNTLNSISNVLSMTYGPMGSNTLLLRGNSAETIVAEYSKDGAKVLKSLKFQDPIEMSIQSQIRDITDFVDKEVGDATTSATLLSTAVFNRLCEMDTDETPYTIIRTFQKIVAKIQDIILKKSKPISEEDIYDLCMISTNGNEKVSNTITDIYKEYGTDVFVDTAVSTTEDDVIRVFDGLTLDEGYSDVAYINGSDGKCTIDTPEIYAFNDPIDTTEMAAFLNQIIEDNITSGDELIPTVIIAPKISRDVAPIIEKLCEFLLAFKSSKISEKPPILIVTNLLGGNMDKYYDIAKLCGCKMIRKYIDPKIQMADIEKGIAPTPETIHDFAGKCRRVVADASDTKFINPVDMYESDETGLYIEDENGEYIKTTTYASLLQFVNDAMENSITNGDDDITVNKYRKRLQSLKANYVEYMVGGITIADREATRDLVQDAIRNCRSASNNGVGMAANFEGLLAAKCIKDTYSDLADIKNISNSLELKIANVIYNSYKDILDILYSSYDKDKAEEMVESSIEHGMPFNLRTEQYDGKVLTSIMTDVKVLDAISKIITIMYTANQCLVQAPQINIYQ